MGRASREQEEAVELLAPDARAFGGSTDDGTLFAGFDDDGDDPFDEPAARPWLVGASIAVVAALVLGGVVASSPWDDEAASTTTTPATTAPATTVPSTATPTTTPTVDDPQPTTAGEPAIVLDPVPDGFRLTVAFWDEPAADFEGWSELWASPGATRTSGRWFEVSLQRERARYPVADPEFLDVGGRSGRLVVDPDGVVELQVSIGQTDAEQYLTVRGFGSSRDEVLGLTSSIGVIDDRPQLVDDRPDYADPSLLDGLALVAAGSSDNGLLEDLLLPTNASALTGYERATDLLALTLDSPSSGGDALGSIAVSPVAGATATEAPPGFTGEGLVVGRRWLRGLDVTMARWRQDGRQIQLLTTLGASEVLELLPAVRLSGAASVVPAWVLEPGAEGYVAVAAFDPEAGQLDTSPGRLVIHASPGASRDSGAWVAVQTLPRAPTGSAPGRRVDIGGRTGVLETDGASTVVTWSPDGRSTTTVTSHGLGLDEVVAVAERGVAAVRPDLEPVLSRPNTSTRLTDALFERSRSMSTFVRPDDHSTIDVSAAQVDAAEETLLRFVIGDGGAEELVVHGSTMSLATFVDRGTRVIVRSDLPPAELGPLVSLIRPAAADEWADLVAGPPAYVNGPLPVEPAEQQIGLGVTQNGTAWRVAVDPARETVVLDDAGEQERFLTADLLGERHVTLRSTRSTTFVVVRAPRAAGAAIARVRAGDSSRVIALAPIDGDEDHLYGALAFSEDGEVSIDLLDGAGRLVDDAA